MRAPRHLLRASGTTWRDSLTPYVARDLFARKDARVKEMDAATFTAVFGLTAVVVVVAGYSIGRAHAAWQSVGIVKRRVKAARTEAWISIRNAATLVVLVLLLVIAVIRNAYSG